jgi:hypothetical protein
MADLDRRLVLDSSRGVVTRRSAIGLLAGGLVSVAWGEMSEARKQRHGRVKTQAKPAGNPGAQQRPFADFLDAQGTSTIFVPPAPDVIGWAEPPFDASTPFAWIDYTGKADELLDGILGTTVSGKVTEQAQAGGRKVHVTLHAKNALSWVTTLDLACETPDCVLPQFGGNPLLFGRRLQDLGGDPSLAALGEANLEVTFTDDKSPGDPLPDLVVGSYQQVFLKFHAHADGPLREEFGVAEGTPGRLTVVQTGVQLDSLVDCNEFPDAKRCRTAIADGFPAEQVRLQPVGH